METDLADILEQCLIRLEAGATVEECLRDYPQQRGELEGPLQASLRLRALPQPVLAESARAAIEARMLARLATRPATPPEPAASPGLDQRLAPQQLLERALRGLGLRGLPAAPWQRLAAAALILLVALLLGAGVVAAARAILSRLLPPAAQFEPAQRFMLEGPIEQQDLAGWVVNGFAVVLDAQTTISGTLVPGAQARIVGTIRDDGRLLAETITVISLPPPTPVPPTATATLPPATATPAPLATVVPTAAPTAVPPPPVVPTAAPTAVPPPPVVPTAAPPPPPPPPAPPGDDGDDDDDGDDGGDD